MISQEQAQELARHWIEAWNQHDLDGVMNHYASDVEFHSPFVARLLSEPSGVINDKSKLRTYFEKGLAQYPDLSFELFKVLPGMSSIAVYYRSVKNLFAVEIFELNADGLVSRVLAHYAEPD